MSKGIKTSTIHLATRFFQKETIVMVNGKEYPVQKIIGNGNKVILVVSE